MSREEAKEILVYMADEKRASVTNNNSNLEALEMAIKALSQEPTVTSTDEPITMVYPQVDGITPTVVEKPQTEIKPDGTLVVNSVFYPKVKRVLVECGTDGTLFYANERPMGVWKLWNEGCLDETYVCSECDGASPFDYKFCPNCGSRMAGGK